MVVDNPMEVSEVLMLITRRTLQDTLEELVKDPTLQFTTLPSLVFQVKVQIRLLEETLENILMLGI